jgi:tetratricopeptide (TPR) repeat protein
MGIRDTRWRAAGSVLGPTCIVALLLGAGAPARSADDPLPAEAAATAPSTGVPAGKQDASERREVRDPYFGATLYDFFQSRYFSALTGLMVSQQFGRVAHHADEAEILRGGLYLSYGLHREAAEIFTRLIDQGAPPAIRDRAWYYLAKIRYQRGLIPQAEEALGRIRGRLPPPLEDDRTLLAANLLMMRGDYAGAAVRLGALAKGDNASLYARYNLGVALVKSGEVARGSEMLDEIGVEPAVTEEFLSLRDKANVALGFAALQNKDPERAKVYLGRVRLSGMLASRALLAFGWASDELHQPKEALVPWMELAGRDTSDAAVLEAKLAVPYAMAQIGAYGPALEQYGAAINAFDEESNRLDGSIAAIRTGKLLDALIARNPGEEMGWFWNIDQLPEMRHGGHLVPVFAQHEFQEAFKNYRDLQFLARNLQDWESKLDVIGDMLDNRRQAFADRLPQVQVRERDVNIGRLEKRRDALGAELQDAGKKGDGVAFADARERALAVRLERVRAILDRQGASAEEEARARYRRVAGALGWQLVQEFPQRLWDTQKDFKQLAVELLQARERDARLVAAQREEPARFDRFGARIVALQQRVQALKPKVAQLVALQRQAVEDLAVADLEQQKERLAAYGNQARFAVAQLYDRAGVAQDSAHAPKP